MKKFLLFIVLLAGMTNLFGQQITPDTTHHGTKDYYLQKSKRQKSAAWSLLIGGVVLMGGGLLIGDRNNSSFDEAGVGAIMFGIGFLADIGSIPLFIASGKNKKRAMKASAGLKIQDALVVQRQSTIMNARFPAVLVKIRL